MKIEKGTVRAPEIGRMWFNSPPLSLRQLRGKVVLIDFWDYTCVNCVRTLPYLKAWHEKYFAKGLVVIGIHTPEFTFAQYESNVERGIREFGLEYPVVSDNNYELWKAFANRAWPSKYLIDKDGYARYAHMGEGAYQETEREIQGLLRESNPRVELPPVMEPLRPEDYPGAVCFQASPELYLGHRRGRIGNSDGFQEDRSADYALPFAAPAEAQEGVFYLAGRWSSTAEFIESSAGAEESRIVLRYSAAAVNVVMAANRTSSAEVFVRQDGHSLSRALATSDISFQSSELQSSRLQQSKLGVASQPEESVIVVTRLRMYALLDNGSFGEHTLELTCRTPGVAVYAFTFTGCVSKPGRQDKGQ